jgi:hypothetical protein
MRNQIVVALLGSAAVFGLYTYAFAQGVSGLSFMPNVYYGQSQTSPFAPSVQSRTNNSESSYAYYPGTRRQAHSRNRAPVRTVEEQR